MFSKNPVSSSLSGQVIWVQVPATRYKLHQLPQPHPACSATSTAMSWASHNDVLEEKTMPRRAQPLQLPETHISLISRAGISLLGLVLLPSCAHIYVYTAKQGLCCPSQHPAQRSGLVMFASKGWTGIAAFFQSKHVPKNLPLHGGCPCNLPGSVTLQATSCCRRCEMFLSGV